MDKICETHGRLRCSECNYVGELEERVNTLNKVIDELKLDEERLTDKYKSKDGENYLLRRRVQELEKENAHHEKLMRKYHLQAVRNGDIADRRKQALDFYADENNYEFETIVTDCEIEVESPIFKDGGERARKELKGVEG
ncbi:hypothetical protein PD280_06225 [Virgibacillus salarius]|uniref:hypothetical protein n=1 Tax=Virgibacillus salarius TaxID=447199 RepID=UPI002492B464|nr:hypothetical protein [Virgibacillus salarius]WBX81314.1 hypothetical protein PD280_06225 [Virgibacillus salarius]